jgi:hypothetical protein
MRGIDLKVHSKKNITKVIPGFEPQCVYFYHVCSYNTCHENSKKSMFNKDNRLLRCGFFRQNTTFYFMVLYYFAFSSYM